jgi:hypothetical protein
MVFRAVDGFWGSRRRLNFGVATDVVINAVFFQSHCPVIIYRVFSNGGEINYLLNLSRRTQADKINPGLLQL